jgi:hypothetical protein
MGYPPLLTELDTHAGAGLRCRSRASRTDGNTRKEFGLTVFSQTSHLRCYANKNSTGLYSVSSPVRVKRYGQRSIAEQCNCLLGQKGER